MDLEIGQLDLRYEKLRRRNAHKERQLVASLAEKGQIMPVVVVRAGENAVPVLVDGYKRVRALKSLREDLVRATLWDLDEADAVLLERIMRLSEADSPLEQAWLLEELNNRFVLSYEDLGRRFDKSTSWVSRRLALVRVLPREVQEQVQRGALPAHAAMKFLVPLARANRADCVRLVKALTNMHPSTREVEALYAAWVSGNKQTRELVVTRPSVVLKAREQAHNDRVSETKTPGRKLVDDFNILVGVSRRARAKLAHGLLAQLLPTEKQDARHSACQAREECSALFRSAADLMGSAPLPTPGTDSLDGASAGNHQPNGESNAR